MVCRVLADAHKELKKRREDPRTWRLETHGYQCLEYPLRAWFMVLVLALAWTMLITVLIALLPDTWTLTEFMPRFPLLMFVFLLLGYSCACLQTTLGAARAGESDYVAWPERGLVPAVRGGAQAVVCLLAGPVVPAVAAGWFWLNSGDLLWVDWLIVWQLGIVAVGYWALALMAVQERGRFRDAQPAAVVRLVKRLGYRAMLAAVLIAVVVVGHGLLVLDTLEELRGLRGWLQLVGCFAGQFFWMVLLLRWLGVSSYRARQQRRDAMPLARPEPGARRDEAVQYR